MIMVYVTMFGHLVLLAMCLALSSAETNQRRLLATNTFLVGPVPFSLAFDSSGNACVTSFINASVTKLSSLGSTLGTFSVGDRPYGIAIDSFENVWVANVDNDTVTKLNSLGSILGTFAVGSIPEFIAFDDNNDAWITNFGSNTVSKLSNAGLYLARLLLTLDP